MVSQERRVFLVQDVVSRRGIDISDLYQYGNVRALLPEDSALMYNPREMLRLLESGMSDFNDRDYIVAIGDPAAIAATVAMACKVNNWKYSLLRWDKDDRKYHMITHDMR